MTRRACFFLDRAPKFGSFCLVSDYKGSELFALLNEPIPALRKIESCLRVTPPAVLAEMIEAEPESTYIIDYYLRLFEPEVGERFVNAPDMPAPILAELFNCQVIRHYLAAMTVDPARPPPSLKSSYWSHIGRERMTQLFKQLLGKSDSARFSAVMILQRMELSDLRFLSSAETSTVLDYFRTMGPEFADAIARNLDLYDYLYRVARDRSDGEYLEFLDQYTNFVVQLRVAENLTQEAQRLAEADGMIPFRNLVALVEGAPPDSIELMLKILVHRKFVSEETAKSLLSYRSPGAGT